MFWVKKKIENRDDENNRLKKKTKGKKGLKQRD